MKTSYAILLPAYNVEKYIADLLAKILQLHPDCAVIVVDDGSQDRTGEIACSYSNIELVQHKKNRGKGAALRTGITHILCKQLAKTAIIFLDSDGQHDPHEIRNLIQAFREQKRDFIIGKRSFKIGIMPIARILSNTLTSLLISVKLRVRIRDSQSGFRMISLDVIKNILPLRADDYAFETELLIKAAKNGAALRHVEINTIYDRTRTSHIKGFRDTVTFIRTLLTT